MGGAGAGLPLHPVGRQMLLHRVPQFRLDNRVVLAGVDLPLMRHLAAIQPVLQDQIQRPPRQRPATAQAFIRHIRALLAADAGRGQRLGQPANRAEFQVAAIDPPHRLRLGRVHHQLALPHIVAQRHDATHPDPLPLGGGDLVADALAGDLALELGEGQQHVQGQASHAGGGVELLGDGDEAGALGVEHLDDLGEVGERAGQPVDLVDDDQVDLAGADIGEQLPQGRAFEGAAGDAAIVIQGGQQHPALMALTGDIGGAGLALGIERVERLFQPLLGGFAGVDGAAAHATLRPPGLGHGGFSGGAHPRPPRPPPVGFRSGRRSVGRTSGHR